MSKAKRPAPKKAPKAVAGPKKKPKVTPPKPKVKAIKTGATKALNTAAKSVTGKPMGKPATSPKKLARPTPPVTPATGAGTPEPESSLPVSPPADGIVPLAQDGPGAIVVGYKFTDEGPAKVVTAVDERGKPVQFATAEPGEVMPTVAPGMATELNALGEVQAELRDRVNATSTVPKVFDNATGTWGAPAAVVGGSPSDANYSHAHHSSNPEELTAESLAPLPPLSPLGIHDATTPAGDKPTTLTPEQFKELGERLLRTGGNIFTITRVQYGVDGGDELFEGVKKHAQACKCESCDQWKLEGEMAKGVTGDVCEDCAGSGDGETD